MDAEARVRAVLAAARSMRAALDDDAVRALAAESRLSVANVRRGLAEHLETDATDGAIASLRASVIPADTTHVVLSANVFVAPVRALALAVAASSRVRVRASTRAPIVPRLLIAALDRALDVALVDALAPAPGDRVHAYGRTESLAAIRASLPAGVALWAHGPGFGVAVLDEDGVAGLAADTAIFDQRGCLSPRVAFVVGSIDRARGLARDLAAALEREKTDVPVDQADPVADATYARTMAMVGATFGSIGARVGFDPEPRALTLPDAARTIHVVRARDEAHARALLEPLSAFVTTIGGAGALADALAITAPRARRSALGRMQKPPFDGPVDRRQ